MKALKKAEYNSSAVPEPAVPAEPRASGVAPPAGAALFASTPATPPLYIKVLLLGFLLIGLLGLWFLFRPNPAPPIYLKKTAVPATAPAIPAAPVSIPAPEAEEVKLVVRPLAVPPAQVSVKTTLPPPAKRSDPAPREPRAPIVTPMQPVPSVDPVLERAYLALQQGNASLAEELYKQAQAREPNNIDALLGLATLAAARQQNETALQLYSRVLEQDAKNSIAQAGLINLIGKSDFIRAESRLRQLIQEKPGAHLYFTLGNLYAGEGQWQLAQQAYFDAYHLQPSNADFSYNLAVALDHLGSRRQALEYYQKALSLSEEKATGNFHPSQLKRRIAELNNLTP